MAKSREEYLKGHDPTHIGEAGDYLQAELPDVDIGNLAERFDYWKEHREIPERFSAFDCRECGGRLLITDYANAAECENCGQVVFTGENDG